MAVRKVIHKDGSRSVQTITPDDSDVTVNILDEPTKVSQNPGDYTYLIYGPKKIGKTDFIAQFPDTYHLMFEKKAEHLAIRQSLMHSWPVAEAYVKELLKNPRDIRSLNLDGMGAMYDKALVQACRENGFQHPGGQDDFGKSWDAVKRCFHRIVDKVIESNFGCFFCTHDIAVTHETYEGVKTFIIPNVPKQAEEFIRLKIDNVFYYHYRARKRWLQIRGDEVIYAGCAPKKNFLTPSGEQIYMIPMGNSAEQGYKNFINAFNNKQKETYEEIRKEDIDELEKPKGDTSVRKVRQKRSR